MGAAPDIDVVLRGMSGLGGLCYYVGMLYFGFILMRVRAGRPEQVFFWAVVSQMLGLVLMAALSLSMMLFGYSLMGGGGMNWIGLASSALHGWVLASGMVGAVALMVSAKRGWADPGIAG